MAIVNLDFESKLKVQRNKLTTLNLCFSFFIFFFLFQTPLLPSTSLLFRDFS